jgi:peptidyl-tRNA hydrolase, PTH2 family
MADGVSPQVVVTTGLISLLSGYLLGVYAIRGYVFSPALKEERDANWKDPVESEESDIDEDDTILDHAPNWGNGEEADRRQGLRATKAPAVAPKSNEECKLVLVVRTDLGMTKGMLLLRQ